MNMRSTSQPSPLYDTPVSPRPWTARRDPLHRPAPRQTSVTRRFEILWQSGTDIDDRSIVAPALPVFEEAFAAFSHGVLIQTVDGPVAVEDLLPGMMLDTVAGPPVRLMWKGAITLVPGAPTMAKRPNRLYRVTADALGPGRPAQDQGFGPYARRLNTDPKVRANIGADAALMPVHELADGFAVVEVTPVSPTRVYHLVCEHHAAIFAAGLPVESYHPGPDTVLAMSEEVMQIYLNFFPHLSDIRDFGRLVAPRLSGAELV